MLRSMGVKERTLNMQNNKMLEARLPWEAELRTTEAAMTVSK